MLFNMKLTVKSINMIPLSLSSHHICHQLYMKHVANFCSNFSNVIHPRYPADGLYQKMQLVRGIRHITTSPNPKPSERRT